MILSIIFNFNWTIFCKDNVCVIMQQVMLLTFQHLLFPQVAQEAQDLEEGLRGK